MGGTALALLAFCDWYRLKPTKFKEKIIKSILNYIYFIQRKDGSFICYAERTGHPIIRRKRALYYPGETALAMFSALELFPSPKLKKSIEKALYSFVKRHKKGGQYCHWEVQALSKGSKIYQNPIFLHTASEMCKDLLASPIHPS